MARRLLLTGAASLALVGAAPAQAAEPAEPPPMAFAETGTLPLDKEKGARATVVNNTRRAIEATVRLDLFGTRREDALFTVGTPVTIPAGGAEQVVVGVKAPGAIPDGSYTGFLSVAGEGTVARRPVSIVVAPPGKKVPTSLVRKRTLTVLRHAPLADEGELVLALDPAAVPPDTPGSNILLPAAPLGTVVDDGGHAAIVRSAGRVEKLDSGVLGLVLEVDGLDGIGLYSGTIDVPQGTPVELKVRHSDGIVWPALALLAGIVLALGSRRFLGLKRASYQLREAEAQLSADLAREPQVAGFKVTDVGARRAAARDAIARLEASGFAEPSGEARKAAEEAIASLRTGLLAWRALPAQLAALKEALEGLDKLAGKPPRPLPAAPGARLPPVFAAAAAELTKGGDVTLAGLVARVEEIELARAAVAAFPAFAARTSLLWDLAQQLAARESELGDRREDLVQARGLVAGAWLQALLADSPETLRAAKLDEQLDRALSRLARLTDVFGDERRTKAAPDEAPERAAALDAIGIGGPRGATPRAESAEAAERRAFGWWARRRAWEGGLTLVALALALTTGLDALYFGHEFGTPRDYVNAGLWGFATKTALDGFVAVAERVRGGAPAWLRRPT